MTIENDESAYVVWYVDSQEEANEALAYADNEAAYHGKPIHVVDRTHKFRYGIEVPKY